MDELPQSTYTVTRRVIGDPANQEPEPEPKPDFRTVGNTVIDTNEPGGMRQYVEFRQAKWLAENNYGVRPPPVETTPTDYNEIYNVVMRGFPGDPEGIKPDGWGGYDYARGPK